MCEAGKKKKKMITQKRKRNVRLRNRADIVRVLILEVKVGIMSVNF